MKNKLRIVFFSFFSGTLLFQGNIVGNALFIKYFQAENLVFVYLISGILTSLISFIVTYKKLKINFIMPLFLLILIAIMGWFYFVNTKVSEYAYFSIAVLFVSTTAGYMLYGQFFLQFLNARFDLREIKQNYSTIQSGELTSYLVGGFVMPLVLSNTSFPITVFIPFAMISGVIGILLFFSIKVKPDLKKEINQEPVKFKKGGIKTKHNFLWIIVIFTACQAFVFCFVDYLYNSSMKEQFSSPEQLGFYFAFFSAVAKTGAVLISVTAGKKVIRKLGVGGSLVILPIVVSTFLIIGGLTTFIGIQGSIVVLLSFVLSKMSFSIVGIPFANTAFSTILQLFPTEDQNKTVAFVLGIARPLASSFAGLGLYLIFFQTGSIHETYLMMMAGFLLAAWLIMTFILFFRYTERLRTLLGTMLQPGSDLTVDDESLKNLMNKMVSERNYIGTLQILSLIEKHKPEQIPQLIEKKFQNATNDEKIYLLNYIGKNDIVSLKPIVKSFLYEQKYPDVAVAAIKCIAAIGDRDEIKNIIVKLESNDNKVIDTVLGVYLKMKFCDLEDLNNLLTRLLNSKLCEDIVRVIDIFKNSGTIIPGDFKNKYMLMNEQSVDRAIIDYAGETKDEDVFKFVVKKLPEAKTFLNSYNICKKIGSQIFSTITSKYSDVMSDIEKRKILLTISQMEGKEINLFMQKQLLTPNWKDFRLIADVFLVRSFNKNIIPDNEKTMIWERISERISFLLELRNIELKKHVVSSWQKALDEEIEYEFSALLFVVSGFLSRQDIVTIKRNMFSNDKKKAALAVELFERNIRNAGFLKNINILDKIICSEDRGSKISISLNEFLENTNFSRNSFSKYLQSLIDNIQEDYTNERTRKNLST